jgi:hypothetical protein
VEFNDFKSDKKKSQDGVWKPCGNGRILIASTNSERYKEVMRRLLAPHEIGLALGTMDEQTSQDILIQALAEGVLLGWEGFTENGEAVTYTPENAFRLMKDAPLFRAFVEKEANNLDNFRFKKEELEIKN